MTEEATITAIVVTAQRKTKCFMRRSSYDSALNTGEKQLANHQMRVKRIEIINTE